MTQLPDWTTYIHHDSSEVYLSDVTPRINDTITVKNPCARVSAPIEVLFILRSRPDGEWKRIKMSKTETTEVCEWWSAEMPITHVSQ